MSVLSAKEMRNAILQAISKRSQTKFAKLFNEFDAHPTQTNIVLVLAELAEQKDFYVDFNIPLKYFLDLYEELAESNKNFMFNEAGLLVHNATKIYDRRLDCVLQRVEDQLASLANCQESKENNSTQEESNKKIEEKPVKKRKRLVDSLSQDPFEFQWTRRKFKKLAEDKRFGAGSKIDRSKLMARKLHMENYLHPALWKYSEIVDLENEEEIDSKRNYRLFTSYLEHRYNTLVPDINFRLYYKMKDYLDAEDERDDEHSINKSWPPLSQAFVKLYLKMEDRALAHIQSNAKHRGSESSKVTGDNQSQLQPFDSGISLNCSDETIAPVEGQSIHSAIVTTENVAAKNSGVLTESGIGTSIDNSTTTEATATLSADITNHVQDGTTIDINASLVEEISSSTAINSTQIDESKSDSATAMTFNETESLNAANTVSSTNLKDNEINEDVTEKTVQDTSQTTDTEQIKTQSAGGNEETVEVTVHIGTRENGESKSDSATAMTFNETESLNAVDTVSSTNLKDYEINEDVTEKTVKDTSQTTDTEQIKTQSAGGNEETIEVTVHIGTRENGDDAPLTPITIHVDKSALNGLEKTTESADEINLNNLQEFYLTPQQTPIEFWPIKLNIFDFPREVLKKMRRPKLLTDLGKDMESYLKARLYKRTRAANDSLNKREMKLLDNCKSSASAIYETPPPSPCDTVFLGFDEEGTAITRPSMSDDELHNNSAIEPLKIGEHYQRLSRDSGVGNDLLTASPEKNSMLFPPIIEQTQETQEEAHNSVSIDILENRLLVTAKSEPTESLTNNNEVKQPEVLTEIATVGEEAEKSKSVNKASTGNEDIDFDSFMDVTNINRDESFDNDASNLNDEKHAELCDDTVAKIQTWHRTLQPILTKSRERHHFDVFQIGTSILDTFKMKTQPDNSITFQDVMQHQDPSYVSRYFLSSLLLANQGNLALKVNNKSDDKPSEWCDVHFKLLSKARHVVAVEDNIGIYVPAKEKSMLTTSQTTNTKSPPSTPTTSPKKSKLPKLLPPPPPPPAEKSRKRKLSIAANTAAALSACNMNLKGIETIKPIGKTPRLSEEDSGIASLESDMFDISS